MMKKLLNPLAYYNTKTLLFIGIITHLLFCYIAYATHSFFPDFLSIKKSTIDFKFIVILYQNTRTLAIAIFFLFFKIKENATINYLSGMKDNVLAHK